jgi:predicted MPP superfamily phosphohydrolase
MVFRVILPILLFSLQFMLYVKTAKWLKTTYPRVKWALYLTRFLFVVFNGAALYVFLQPVRTAELPQWFMYTGVYPFTLWHGATFLIGLFVVVTWLIKLPFKITLWISKVFSAPRQKIEQIQAKPAYQRFDASRRTFLRRSMYGLTAVSFGGNAYGMLIGKSSYDITEATFAIPHLPPGLSGFTIGLISDIHSSIFMSKTEMDEYVRLVNSLQTDMIVVPGDFVNSAVEQVYPFAESFSNLRAPLGVYGVMGNHDFYNHNPDLVAKEVNDCGVTLLRNDKRIIEKNGDQFYLIGVDDVGRETTAMVKFETAIGHAPLEIPRILLCHRPYYLRQAADRNIDLVLSGHTHGGQIVLGRIGDTVIAPASIASTYICGKYSLGNTHMYVSRGIGTVALPIRINCPAEITRITLVSS